MKKLTYPFVLVSLFIVLCFNASAFSSLENDSTIGTDMSNLVVISESISLNEELVTYQENNAENNVQLGVDEIDVDTKKQRILADTSFLWKLIAGEFRMILELIKIMFYALEIYIFMFFMFKVVPNIMLKIREVIVNWYQDKKEL